MSKHRIKHVHYCLYHHDTNELLDRLEYASGGQPPVPREGDLLGVGGNEMLFVVVRVAHYFESPIHEIALMVQDHTLYRPELQATVRAAYQAPLDAHGNCAYCHDEECVGGEDCNFYDGSLG